VINPFTLIKKEGQIFEFLRMNSTIQTHTLTTSNPLLSCFTLTVQRFTLWMMQG
jgi:hypothetical protein